MVAKSTPRGMEVIAQVAANDRGEGRPGADSRWCNEGGGRHLQGLVQFVTETGQPGRSDGAFLDDEAAPRPTVQEPRRPMTALGIPQIREFFRAESVMGHEERFPPPRLSAGFSIAVNVKPCPDHLIPPPSCVSADVSHGALASLRGRRQAAS